MLWNQHDVCDHGFLGSRAYQTTDSLVHAPVSRGSWASAIYLRETFSATINFSPLTTRSWNRSHQHPLAVRRRSRRTHVRTNLHMIK